MQIFNILYSSRPASGEFGNYISELLSPLITMILSMHLMNVMNPSQSLPWLGTGTLPFDRKR